MKRVIFTIYDDIECDTEVEHVNKAKLQEYFDILLQNKKDYAEKIGVEFIFYHNTYDSSFLEVKDQYVGINLYKIHLLEKLSRKYDEILYVDFDVIFNTNKNFFEKFDLKKGIVVKDQNHEIIAKDPDNNAIYEMPKRCPTLKYFITKELLKGKENNVLNTGIIGAHKKHIKKLKFLQRFNTISKKIEKLKDPLHFVRKEYYPNNEAIFSYLLERYKIPYVLMDHDWHDIRDHLVIDRPFGHMIHFINKIFDDYYKTKKRVVYTLYIEIPDDKLDDPGRYDWDNISKSERTKLQLIKYHDRLLDNKKQYAKTCNADFKMYGYDDQYIEFSKKFPLLSEYDIINLYKIWLIEELSKEYDYILYLDFDVVANRQSDFFANNDVESRICCQYNDVTSETRMNSERYNRGFRAPITKHWNAHALCNEHDQELAPYVFNTGIIGTSKKITKKLGFFDDIDSTIDLMTEIKNDEFSMYPPLIRKQFGYDNESIFGYKVKMNEVPYENLKPKWHYRADAENPSRRALEIENPILIHFINKKFEWYWDD